jgi:hypothetical protein
VDGGILQYGGTDVMERSCAVARGKDINNTAVLQAQYSHRNRQEARRGTQEQERRRNEGEGEGPRSSLGCCVTVLRQRIVYNRIPRYNITVELYIILYALI